MQDTTDASMLTTARLLCTFCFWCITYSYSHFSHLSMYLFTLKTYLYVSETFFFQTQQKNRHKSNLKSHCGLHIVQTSLFCRKKINISWNERSWKTFWQNFCCLKQERNPLRREFCVCRSTIGTVFAFPPEQTLIICISAETSWQILGACGMYLPCLISADITWLRR